MRLIDADVLKEKIEVYRKDAKKCLGMVGDCIINSIECIINRVSTSEAEPVRHGKWVYKCNDELDDIPCCSICGEPDALSRNDYEYRGGKIRDNNSNYCPNCGAKMEEQK